MLICLDPHIPIASFGIAPPDDLQRVCLETAITQSCAKRIDLSGSLYGKIKISRPCIREPEHVIAYTQQPLRFGLLQPGNCLLARRNALAEVSCKGTFHCQPEISSTDGDSIAALQRCTERMLRMLSG